MIIFGVHWSQQRVSELPVVTYPCPKCGVERNFGEHRMRKVISLYWQPVYTLELGSHFWMCPDCKGQYKIPAQFRGRGEEPEGPW